MPRPRPAWPIALALLVASIPARADDPPAAAFALGRDAVDVFDFAEITATPAHPPAGNPFRDASLAGEFRKDGGDGAPVRVEGFCDAADGSAYRIRFMPREPGTYTYQVTWKSGASEATATGRFEARAAGRGGPIRVDPDHPWHFVREGTGEHVFVNGTTTYWLLGWEDEGVIRASIDRLAGLKVNRLRVALNARTTGGDRWGEPLVRDTDGFRFRLDPWPAARPDDPKNPGLDVTRFNLPFWRKCERTLAHAREQGVFLSIIFHLDGADPGVDPFGRDRAGGPDEQAYYRYAVARLAAYANVMWDVTNEWHLFRDEAWVSRMGALIREADPYDHLVSVHGDERFPFRAQPWADFALYQSWDDGGGYAFMLNNRREQERAGRPMPQINEEYGYEDHYPTWGAGKRYPARSADNRRRLAWGMCMAGGYQTTGERADRGTGASIDSGGGWLNGRGDDTMTMLAGYAHMVDAFTGLAWWRMDPHPDLVDGDGGALCLAEPGSQYLAYLPAGRPATLRLAPGRYAARRLDCRSGAWADLGPVEGGEWTTPAMPDGGDWAVTLVRAEEIP